VRWICSALSWGIWVPDGEASLKRSRAGDQWHAIVRARASLIIVERGGQTCGKIGETRTSCRLGSLASDVEIHGELPRMGSLTQGLDFVNRFVPDPRVDHVFVKTSPRNRKS